MPHWETDPGWDFEAPKVRNKIQAEILEALKVPKDKRVEWLSENAIKLRALTQNDPTFLASVQNHDWPGAREALIRAGRFRSFEVFGEESDKEVGKSGI